MGLADLLYELLFQEPSVAHAFDVVERHEDAGRWDAARKAEDRAYKLHNKLYDELLYQPDNLEILEKESLEAMESE